MSPRPTFRVVPPLEREEAADFKGLARQMTTARLHEIGPAGPGAEASALGFTLALAQAWVGKAGLIWAGEDTVFAESGAPYAPGLLQYGLDPARLVVVRAKKRDEALWAAEQGLSAPGAVVICALGDHRKALDLKATRRLLLIAERNGAHCLLLQRANAPTAAWTRWSIAPAPSQAENRELGAPAFHATLTRHRAGRSGQNFILDWNGHDLVERDAVAGASSAASDDGRADPRRSRAV